MSTTLSLTRSARLFRPLLAVAVALAMTTSAAATELSGCWEGYWKSCSTRHNGKLRATITKLDDTRYCARFSGTFFKIVPFRYTTVLNATPQGDRVKLSGESYLRRLMGTFYYDGMADDCNFSMNYSSCKDHGIFRMCRTGCCR